MARSEQRRIERMVDRASRHGERSGYTRFHVYVNGSAVYVNLEEDSDEKLTQVASALGSDKVSMLNSLRDMPEGEDRARLKNACRIVARKHASVCEEIRLRGNGLGAVKVRFLCSFYDRAKALLPKDVFDALQAATDKSFDNNASSPG